jgi:flagellar biosynthesis protein FlhF
MELGSDIYIIGRKEVKNGGFLGMFTKTSHEITVAKNEDTPGSQKSRAKTGVAQKKADAEVQGTRQESHLLSTLSTELTELKEQLRELVNQGSGQEGPGKDTGKSGSLDQLVAVLRENDFSEEYISRVKERFENELTLKDLDTEGTLEKSLRSHIVERIQIADPIRVGNGNPRVVVLVGPTGVGKTTTIAKLAASFGVLQKHKVELLTIDSYRIAAVEQLQKYAELMQIPFTAVTSRDEFKNTVAASSAELIFVDTVGRSQRNNMGLAELRNILDGVKSPMDVHLVLSATTKYRDAIDITARFNQLMYQKVIISKIDETNSIGSILSVLTGERKLSYFTTGQGVPDDIEIAQKEKLLNLLDFERLRHKLED